MRMLVGGAVVVLAVALAFIIWNFNLDVLVEVFLSQPTPQKVAWIVVVAASLLLLGLALWQGEMLLSSAKLRKRWSIAFMESGKLSISSRRHNLTPTSPRITFFAPIPQMRSALSRSGSPALKRWYNRKICAIKR